MSIVGKGYQYLNFLADFWTVFYSDAPVLETLLQTEAEIVKGLYFSFLQEQLPAPVQNARIFDEQFWNVVEIIYEDPSFKIETRKGITYYSYLLDEAYAHIPQLYNVIFNPTVRLKENVDFLLERALLSSGGGDSVLPQVESRILFKEDPFLNNSIAKRINANNKYSMTFFAPKAFIDDQRLYELYGSLIGIEGLSSEEYKAFLTGLMFIFTNGPSIGALNAGLCLAAGYPVARATEFIDKVLLENNIFTLYSNLGHSYEIPRKVVQHYDNATQQVQNLVYPTLKLSKFRWVDDTGVGQQAVDFTDPLLPDGEYPCHFPVDTFSTFITDIRIVDYQTEAYWWREQVGRLSSTLVPGLPDTLKNNKMVKEYLFDNFFKYNTFGVFIDYKAFRADFGKIPDFLTILKHVKPTTKSFIVYEDDLSVFSIVRFNPSTVSLQGQVLPSPVSDKVVLGDGTIVNSDPRTTVIPTPTTDPATGLPIHGNDPATGNPPPSNADIKTVFDAVGLRNFLEIYDIYGVEKYIAMNLPLDNQPIQIGIALEQFHHSLDIISWRSSLSIFSRLAISPGVEPVVGMEMGIGLTPDEGVIERLNFSSIIQLPDLLMTAPSDNSPILARIDTPFPIYVLTTPVIISPTSFSTSFINLDAGVTLAEMQISNDGFLTTTTLPLISCSASPTPVDVVVTHGFTVDTVSIRIRATFGLERGGWGTTSFFIPVVAPEWLHSFTTGNPLADSTD